jgi:hypothetical protein
MPADETPALPFGLSRETRIRIDKEGRFHHEDDLITHEALARSLAGWVDVDAESGRYILRNDINWAFVTVDDTPLVVKRFYEDDRLLLTDGTEEPLDWASLTVSDDDIPYVRVRSGKLPARFSRQAAYSFLEKARTDEQGALWHGEHRVPRGRPTPGSAAGPSGS